MHAQGRFQHAVDKLRLITASRLIGRWKQACRLSCLHRAFSTAYQRRLLSLTFSRWRRFREQSVGREHAMTRTAVAACQVRAVSLWRAVARRRATLRQRSEKLSKMVRLSRLRACLVHMRAVVQLCGFYLHHEPIAVRARHVLLMSRCFRALGRFREAMRYKRLLADTGRVLASRLIVNRLCTALSHWHGLARPPSHRWPATSEFRELQALWAARRRQQSLRAWYRQMNIQRKQRAFERLASPRYEPSPRALQEIARIRQRLGHAATPFMPQAARTTGSTNFGASSLPVSHRRGSGPHTSVTGSPGS